MIRCIHCRQLVVMHSNGWWPTATGQRMQRFRCPLCRRAQGRGYEKQYPLLFRRNVMRIVAVVGLFSYGNPYEKMEAETGIPQSTIVDLLGAIKPLPMSDHRHQLVESQRKVVAQYLRAELDIALPLLEFADPNMWRPDARRGQYDLGSQAELVKIRQFIKRQKRQGWCPPPRLRQRLEREFNK